MTQKRFYKHEFGLDKKEIDRMMSDFEELHQTLKEAGITVEEEEKK